MKLHSKYFFQPFVFIMLLLVMLMLSSCSDSSGDDGVRGNIVELEYDSIYAGPIITEFELGPRTSLEEFSEFYAYIFLENQGSQDLTQGELSLSVAYSDDLIEWQDNIVDNIKLLGYNEENIGIEYDVFDFDGFIKEIPDENSELEVTFFAIMKFHYNTELEQEVCINPSLYEAVSGNCQNPQGEVKANSQYSPVVVTGFEQTVSERLGKAYFVFHIENKGMGEVEEINVVKAQLTSEDLLCEFIVGEGEMDGSSYVFGSGEQSVDLDCEYTFDPNLPAMEKVLYLDLSYDYSLYETETLMITKGR